MQAALQEVHMLQGEASRPPGPVADIHLPVDIAERTEQLLDRLGGRPVQQSEEPLEITMLGGEEPIPVLDSVQGINGERRREAVEQAAVD